MGGSDRRAGAVKASLYCGCTSSSMIQALHGFGGDGEDFSLVRTASKHTWCCMDLLGHGRSWKSTESKDYRVQEQTKMVAAKVKGEFLLGYSMGARLALHTVLKYPDLWRGLIMISGTAGLTSGREQRKTWDQDLVKRLQTDTNKEFWEYWSQVPIIQSQARVDEDFRNRRDGRRQKSNLNSLAASILGFGAGVMPSVWDLLHEVGLPVLLIVGEEDTKYWRLGKELHAKLSQSELHVVPDAGHAPHMENPRVVAEIIDGWINSLLQ